jgi:hypothetical protein
MTLPGMSTAVVTTAPGTDISEWPFDVNPACGFR